MAVAMTTNEWLIVTLSPFGRIGALVAGLVAVAIVWLSWRAVRDEPRRGRRAALLLLRFGAVDAALVLFLQPAIRYQSVTRVPNHVAVLVDASDSMRIAEEAGKESRRARIRRWLAEARPALDKLRERHKLDFYTFGERLAPTTYEALLADAPPDAPGEEATDLRGALAAVRARYEGRDLAGVLLFSDGIDNARLAAGRDGDLDADALDFLRGLDAPVHAAWSGRPGLRDVAVARVLADDFAFVRTAVKIEAVVRVVGADAQAAWAGRALPVVLSRDGEPLRTTSITVRPGQSDYRVSFYFTPDRVGKFVYEISTPVLDGESIRENNTRTFLLRVIRDKVRVLLVAGRPSWDERFLRSLLKHDPNVDLISFFILRTPEDVEAVSTDELSLIPFPTDELFAEQLRSFDVIFIQNFNFGPYGIGQYLDEIKRFVDEGGGMAMLGGDLSFTLGGWAGTSVEGLLPVELPPGGANVPVEKLVDPAPFRLELTPEGRGHPLTALRLDVEENAARWARLPELGGTNLVTRARPGATVLGVHPRLRDTDGKPLPVLAVGEAGKGRVLTFTSDSSWRWAFRGGSSCDDASSACRGDARAAQRAYQLFWESAIRWLIKDPALSFLRVESSAPEYRPGQKVRLTIRALSTDYRPLPGAPVNLSITKVASTGERPHPLVARTGVTDDEGELVVELDPPPPGGYRATASATLSGRPTSEDEVFVVRGAGRELEEPEAEDALLRRVASATGGKLIAPGASLDGLRFSEPRVVRVNRHRDVEIWSGWWTLAAAALCLSLEWLLRRRWGYV
jgi:hypothetical protein